MRAYTADPRIRQTLNHISENIGSANQRTQDSLYTFSEHTLQPCLASLRPCFVSVQTCLEASCQPCFNAHDDLRRSRQPRYSRRGREGATFDFYDEWDQDEDEWGNDEMDALLAGNEAHQPGRHSGMSYGYGTRGLRRKSTEARDTPADDPNLVPKSNIFGFLESLPWKIGGRGTRYRPNPSSLQDNVGHRDAGKQKSGTHRGSAKRRVRSDTMDSADTTRSLSSRGDIFPSDDEDDAREIDDEFAYALGRKNTGQTASEERSSKKRPVLDSRDSTKTASSRGSQVSKKKGKRGASSSSERITSLSSPLEDSTPSLADLKHEEVEVAMAEESEIQQKRWAAQRLAAERGLQQRSEAPTTKSESTTGSEEPFEPTVEDSDSRGNVPNLPPPTNKSVLKQPDP